MNAVDVTELDLAHREIERLEARLAELEQADTHVEYGVGGLPNVQILHPTPLRSHANAQLAELQQCWPEARLMQRTVRRDAWTETTS